MYVVSDFLPGVRTLRLAGAPHPRTVLDLYTQVADLLENLAVTLASAEELRRDSLDLKHKLLPTVDGLALRLAAQEARDLTLAALTGGMFSGALDGTLLFSHGQRVSQPQLESGLPYLAQPSRILWDNLDRVLETGDSNWRQGHVDDLQLLSGYGKHENRNSLEEGEAMEAQTRGDRSQFQAFLLASFKGGYAMGVVDAAVVFVGGERPGAPPRG